VISNNGHAGGTATQAGLEGSADSFEQSLELAFEMHNAGRIEEAESLCRALEQIQPKNSQLLFLLGMVLHKTHQDQEAVQWLSLAAENHPQSARIFNGLGCAYQSLKEHTHAAEAFEKSVALEPQAGDTYYNLGKSYYRLEQVERATALFRKAVEINPRDFGSWNNLGKCLKELNHLDASIEAYNRALEIKPDYMLARYGRSISLLASGRLLEGFREYEWRWHSITPRKFPQPLWKGEPAPGKTLFVHAEQGFGDAIQLVRFIAAARQRVARVILECRPELRSLFEYSNCADVVIPYGESIPPFDYFISLSSLPHAFGLTVETIPSQTPYLAVPPREKLPAQPGQLKVGLVWAGNPNHHQDAARSIRLQELGPVLNVPNVAFYSLQQSLPSRDGAFLESMSGIINTDLKFESFQETASAIAKLDLVITVDTAVAHLAGALGKSVWVLIQHSPDWRWFLNRADTPWYPTMQLYRQAERNRWELPVAQIAEALRRMIAAQALSLPNLPSNLAARSLAAAA
jgi:tetratricopeptide (TPR) repeat protein